MATSPILINSLASLFQQVNGGTFTEAQIQTVLLTDAVTNACAWAVAFRVSRAIEGHGNRLDRTAWIARQRVGHQSATSVRYGEDIKAAMDLVRAQSDLVQPRVQATTVHSATALATAALQE